MTSSSCRPLVSHGPRNSADTAHNMNPAAQLRIERVDELSMINIKLKMGGPCEAEQAGEEKAKQELK